VQFVARSRAGVEVVHGVRSSRNSDNTLRRSSARAFYRMFDAMSPTNVPFDAGDFRLTDRGGR
jgi:hypothetical protein